MLEFYHQYARDRTEAEHGYGYRASPVTALAVQFEHLRESPNPRVPDGMHCLAVSLLRYERGSNFQ
ncbi:MAG: hypothetical protein JO233_00235 [Candidatus Eremiobacteraeota bacterium]|nr:hypothetical protein [Candidatus Eremiobacteraeota bacterium]